MEISGGAVASKPKLKVSAKVKTYVLDTNVLLHDPTSIFKFADNNLIMPPKVTWFEPKLRSGLVLHSLD